MKKKIYILVAQIIFLFVTASCLAQNLILNPGCEAPMVNNRIPLWQVVSDTGWTQKTKNPSPHSGIGFFFAGTAADAKLKQEIDLSNYKSLIDLALQKFQFTAYVMSYPQTPADESNIEIEFYNASNILLSFLSFGPYTQTATWEKIDSTILVPKTSRKVVITLHSIRHNGSNNDGYYDDLSLTALNQYTTSISDTICEGQTYLGYKTGGTYIDSFNSVDGRDSIRVLNLTVLSKHSPDLGADKEICEGDSVMLSPGDFSSYLWQDGSTKKYFIAKEAGRYSVMVANTCGSTTDDILIGKRDCTIYFPSAFTPNNDGKNDLFKILNGYSLQEYYLAVYNRWGQKVFETKDPAKGWNGNFNSQAENMGVYIWYCSYKKNNEYKKLKGTVTLLR